MGSLVPSGRRSWAVTLWVGERLVLRVGQAGPDDDRFAEFVSIAFDEQRAARRSAEDAALADVANQFGVEDFEIGGVDCRGAARVRRCRCRTPGRRRRTGWRGKRGAGPEPASGSEKRA